LIALAWLHARELHDNCPEAEWEQTSIDLIGTRRFECATARPDDKQQEKELQGSETRVETSGQPLARLPLAISGNLAHA